jgi:hypothetical protein
MDNHDLMVYLTPHTGDLYKKDNGIVYDELKALLVNSPAYTWIRAFDRNRNGRQAWFALINHYEGTTEQNRVKDAAYATIRNSTYAGERRNWTFDNYYHLHQDAHYDLETYGEHLSENRNVTDFLHGISDPQCAVAKAVVMSNNDFLNDFTAAAQYIASTLNITLLNNSQSKQRSISATECDANKTKEARKKGTRIRNSLVPILLKNGVHCL